MGVIMQQGFPTRCLFTDLYEKYKDYMPVEIASLKPSLFCEALLVALDLEGGKDFQMGLSRVFFRAGKLAFMDDLIYGTPAQMQQIIEKVRLWLAKKRWLQAIHAVRSINICGMIIEDIREEKQRKEMERRMRDEAYQAELRRRQEEERRRLEEEKRKREEEARRRQEEERRRREEIKRKQEEERRRLEEEARKKAARREKKRVLEEQRQKEAAERRRLEEELRMKEDEERRRREEEARAAAEARRLATEKAMEKEARREQKRMQREELEREVTPLLFNRKAAANAERRRE